MTVASYLLPEVVDLSSARGVADDLIRHIQAHPQPGIDASGLRQAGLPLLQILVAARSMAETQGKSLAVHGVEDGALAGLFAIHGLEPSLCGAPARPAPL